MEEQREILYDMISQGADEEAIVMQSQRLDDCITAFMESNKIK